MKVVSFSLWGSQPKYLVGMIRNAELCARFYPGWECRVSAGRSVPRDVIARLTAMPHVRVIEMPHDGDWTSMFWRQLAADDPRADVVVIRDADSRLNARERAAVDAWLAGPHAVHVMRDHPQHTAPMLGGMWGTRVGALAGLASLIAGFRKADHIQIDQDFLAAHVWPAVRGRALVHDEYFGGRRFPTRRVGREFVGQPFDQHDRPEIEGPTAWEQLLKSNARRVLQAIGLREPSPRY